jgi:hypothetical protein
MTRSAPLICVAIPPHYIFTEGTGVLVESLSAWIVEARERAVLEEDDETGTSHLLCRWNTVLRPGQDAHLVGIEAGGIGHDCAETLACVDDESHDI